MLSPVCVAVAAAVDLLGSIGNVFEPRGLDELIPDWKEKGAPVATPVTEDSFSFLTETKAFKIPNFLLPPQLVSLDGEQQKAPPLSLWNVPAVGATNLHVGRPASAELCTEALSFLWTRNSGRRRRADGTEPSSSVALVGVCNGGFWERIYRQRHLLCALRDPFEDVSPKASPRVQS